MPNPIRQEILDAHDAVENLDHMAQNGANLCGDTEDIELCELWKKRILAALPPRPQSTMADVEWDDDKHCLAEAKLDSGSKVIMLGEEPDGTISVFHPGPVRYRGGTVIPDYLTPTGRKFALTEANNE